MPLPARRAPLRTVLCGCVVLCAAAAGCQPLPGTGSPPPQPDVTVGVLLPLTGPDPAAGEELSNGAELAAGIVDDDSAIRVPLGPGTGLPRLGGARIRLAVRDATETPTSGTLAAEILAGRQHPAALVVAGPADSVTAVAVTADRRRIPLVDATTSDGALLEAGRDWYFRTAPSDRILGESVFALFADRGVRGQPVGSIALVQPADARGSSIADTVGDLAEESGTAIAARPRYASTPAGLRSAGRAAAQAKPGAIVLVATTAAEASALVTAVRGVSAGVPVAGLGPGFATAAAGSAALPGILTVASWSPDFAARNPLAKAVAAEYARRYGAPMTERAASAFTAVWTVAAAIDAAGSARPQDVRSALLAADQPATALVMPWLGIRFSTGGQNSAAAAVVQQRTGPDTHVVFPPELATAPLHWTGAPAGARG
ncbi:MAG: amino acid transporter substrate-binding protein [Actinomycetia bacterium]|nr:amino acid transporter substrate-binding protein [Actinomycetes bacterium]MDQ1653943.1 branched-chain amino acid transport system substrate-binding protein [Cryptosporangiaceae bacterium]MDQ1659316.1 branched-chain amino acid transport system substrate-binding protein [Cryptosporangiaceae bacterium]